MNLTAIAVLLGLSVLTLSMTGTVSAQQCKAYTGERRCPANLHRHCQIQPDNRTCHCTCQPQR